MRDFRKKKSRSEFPVDDMKFFTKNYVINKNIDNCFYVSVKIFIKQGVS